MALVVAWYARTSWRRRPDAPAGIRTHTVNSAFATSIAATRSTILSDSSTSSTGSPPPRNRGGCPREPTGKQESDPRARSDNAGPSSDSQRLTQTRAHGTKAVRRRRATTPDFQPGRAPRRGTRDSNGNRQGSGTPVPPAEPPLAPPQRSDAL